MGHKKPKTTQNNAAKEDKYTVEFHKHFDVARTETVITHFACAHKGKFLKQGKIFISQTYIGFHAHIFGKHHKKLVPFLDITDITKEYNGLLNNALKVITIKKKEMIFASFVHRDAAYDAITQQWNLVKEKASRISEEEDEQSYHAPPPHINYKKDTEMKQLSPKDKVGNAPYKNYDVITKKKLPPPSTVQDHDGAEHKHSLADRAQALIDSGAIVNDDKQKDNRPVSQQPMVSLDSSTNTTTTTTIEVEPEKTPKARYRFICCWI